MPEKSQGELVDDKITAEIERHYLAALSKISEKIGGGAAPGEYVNAMLKVTEALQSGQVGALAEMTGRINAMEDEIRNLKNRMNLERKK
jgi:hypothetical protein